MSTTIVDTTADGSKQSGNRQRLLRRAKAAARDAVRRSIADKDIKDVAKSGGVKVTTRGRTLSEPSFGLDPSTGEDNYILPGNKEHVVGDIIHDPSQDPAGRGQKGSNKGEGQDDFTFTLTREEYIEILFEDLGLPDMTKRAFHDANSTATVRAGFKTDGSPNQLDLTRTFLRSQGRRRALGRPTRKQCQALRDEIARLKGLETSVEIQGRIAKLEELLAVFMRKRERVSYIDPVDARYRRSEQKPQRISRAVMFCLMDVSASMVEFLKNLAKRFFLLLHLFLERQYDSVDIVFIRHTTRADEVTEQQFFRDTETGGTVVSTSLVLMNKIVRDRYPLEHWNIYVAQASDGHNYDDDGEECVRLMEEVVLPMVQYFAYIEVSEEETSGPTPTPFVRSMTKSLLWNTYEDLCERWPNLAMEMVRSEEAVYPVFRKLFAKQTGLPAQAA